MPYRLLTACAPFLSLACNAKDQVTAAPADPMDIARQVYYVNHFFGVRNARFGDDWHPIVLVDRNGKGKFRTMAMLRHLNNDYPHGDIRARDLVIFKGGQLKGTGILVNLPRDPQRALSFSIWLPTLRKVRRHTEPNQGDHWGGSLFTYGDIYLRRPGDEQHELLKQAAFPDCLQPMQIPRKQGTHYTRTLPQARCDLKGKHMLRLKSSTRFSNWWYDYRIIWIDPVSFADYRSEYFKNSKKIKVIDKDWRSMGLDDPRAQYWAFWSGREPQSGREGMAFIARAVPVTSLCSTWLSIASCAPAISSSCEPVT